MSAARGDHAQPGPPPPQPEMTASPRVADWLMAETGLCQSGARQLADYFCAAYQALGAIPSQKKLVVERFFDESGGMQLVMHAPFGSRLNRAWGLALRKRFCRSFNFELQAAASDDAIVLSLGTQHSFPLEEVLRYLNSRTARDLLVQALLDAPMFPVRWRWNASRALALPRQRGGRKVPAPLQRMEAENLLAAVFPDQLACLENIAGDREVPNHPLVRQTIEDCLTEAMDINGLEELLRQIERGEIECLARDLPEPSPLAHEILNAKPYAFLDNAPLEERRTQAVYTRRTNETSAAGELGILDAAAIERVCQEAWPRAVNADELHEALLLLGVMSADEVRRALTSGLEDPSFTLLERLASERRAGRMTGGLGFWVPAERLPMVQAVYLDCDLEPALTPPEAEARRSWDHADAVREMVRGRMEVCGPIAAAELAGFFQLPQTEIEAALLALEAEGFVLRGKFHPGATGLEWCERRLLARIHRLTIHRLRAEIQAVSIADFQRFLLVWQRVAPEQRAQGPEGVGAVLELLDGFELPAGAWEPEVLALRVQEYTPQWLDQLCFTGRIGWGRLTPPLHLKARAFAPLRSSPLALFSRENLTHWQALSAGPSTPKASPDTETVLSVLAQGGAMFFSDLVRRTGLLPSRVEQALGELAAEGWATADSFEGLRAMLVPQERRAPLGDAVRKRRHQSVTSIESAGRWSLLRTAGAEARGLKFSEGEIRSLKGEPEPGSTTPAPARDEAIESFARVLLRRYGVMFRRLLERESLKVSWFELGRVYRRLEARGEIRGGHFVGGVSGEQFARPEAIGLLRSLRNTAPTGELIPLSGADPLNLVGVLTPGPRIPAIGANRILLRDGVPLAALEAGRVIKLEEQAVVPDRVLEQALKVGRLPAALRPYYG
ncbi:MAG: hypothetical protein DME25_09885 [Verrucomicrobia bacterium]|nr:MAG: hypothetical protein DME25_09885 [Verrucomicrobiota bacterium]